MYKLKWEYEQVILFTGASSGIGKDAAIQNFDAKIRFTEAHHVEVMALKVLPGEILNFSMFVTLVAR